MLPTYAPIPTTCPQPEVIHPSIGRLHGPHKNCTAWAATPDLLVTAAHCITQVRGKIYRWKGRDFAVYAVHQRADLATLERLSSPPLTFLDYEVGVPWVDTLVGAGCVEDGDKVQAKAVGERLRTCSCKGDSGGPLFAGDVVVGVLSSHYPSLQPGTTRVAHMPLDDLRDVLLTKESQ